MSDEPNDYLSYKRFEGPPQGYFVVVPGDSNAQLIDIAKIGRALWASWKLLLVTALITAVIAVVITLQMRNVYRAVALISPVTDSGGGGNKSAATTALESAMTATAPKANALGSTMTTIPRLRAPADGPAPRFHERTLTPTA